MSSIIDNKPDNLLVEHVNKLLDTSEFSRMAVGYFYLSGFQAIREKLDKIKHLKLIIGNRTNQQTVEELVRGHLSREQTENEIRKQLLPNPKQKHAALSQTQGEYSDDLTLMEQNEQSEKGLSALWELIRDKKIDIRVYTKGFLHSKAYLFDLPEKDYLEGIAVVGSSNLTIGGLSNNSELNVVVSNKNDYTEVKGWFENLWEESEDFNEMFINVVQESWFKKQVSPYDVYIKTLFHLVRDRIEIREHSSLTAFDLTKLFPFQKDAYNRALDILEGKDGEQNGVFISDVVGLGKSYIAIALISYYWSLKQQASLIVCPASLQRMWEDYKDEFHLRCKILPYSQLLFKEGNEQYTLNSEHEFDGYGVVIIDESHNFRNPAAQRYKVLAPYLQGKKVILLTATPQNNTVWDVYHQIKLFHQSDVTDLSISPNNLKTYFQENQDKPEKIAELLQNFLIRRTRRDILNSPRYADVNLHFPKRKLNTLEYSIDETYSEAGESIYEKIINNLFKEKNKDGYKYSIYNLTSFLKQGQAKKKEYVGLSNLGELVRGLLKVLLFKRLESSVESFYHSVHRILKRHDYILRSIELGYVITGEAEQIEIFLDDDNPEDFEGARVNKYTVEDFNIPKLKAAIEADIKALEEVRALVEPIRSDIKKDKKFNVLLENVIKKYGSEKILIFSEFTDTVDYLHRELAKAYPQTQIHKISSRSANSQEKASVIRRFSPRSQTKGGLGEHEKEIQYLVTTDVLSEGQNLQDARILVNYDFHWNPVRLIQRVGRVDRIGSTADTIQVFNFLPDTKIENQLDLQHRVQARIHEIQRIFGEDSKILTEEEILNEKSLFAIYSNRDENILEAEDTISTIFDKAEHILLTLQKENLQEYERITKLKDGIRTACFVSTKGFYAYLGSGNLHRLYFIEGDSINQNIAEVLQKIEAKPDDPKPVAFDAIQHNGELKKIYDHFKEELIKRRAEIESSQTTPEQKYFRDRLQASFNLFNDAPHIQKKADELYKIFSKEIPDYAKSQLRRLRRENPSDDKAMFDSLQNLVETARILTFQEKEKESENLIVRTICSEGFN